MLDFIKSIFLTNDDYSFDNSNLLLPLINEYKNDPITLIYLVNYLTKSYIINRNNKLITWDEQNQIKLPNIEALPNGINRYELNNELVTSNIIHLQSSSIIPWTWNKSRLINCMKHIETENNLWAFDSLNHQVKFLFPMCYSIVYGGNHSLTTGILKGSVANFEENCYYDLSESYKSIKYKNGYFYSPQGKFKLSANEKITGILFEAGRLIMNSGFSFNDYVNEYQNKYDPLKSKLAKEFTLLEDSRIELIKLISSYYSK